MWVGEHLAGEAMRMAVKVVRRLRLRLIPFFAKVKPPWERFGSQDLSLNEMHLECWLVSVLAPTRAGNLCRTVANNEVREGRV